MLFQGFISGRPITKKTSQKIVYPGQSRKPKVIQNEAYQKYHESAIFQLRSIFNTRGMKTITEPVRGEFIYTMPSKRSFPDLVNLIQATCDILEDAQIIENDRQIVRFDGSHIKGFDSENPGVEVKLWEIENEVYTFI